MIKIAKKSFQHIKNDSLYRNSIYLILSTLVLAFFGFFFWIINARLFPPSQIGVATTLVSIGSLIANFSLLGFNAGLVRYLPTSPEKNRQINTTFTLITVTAGIIAIGYLAGIHIFSPKLKFITDNILFTLIFIGTIIFVSFNLFVDNVFIAYRSTRYILIKSALLGIAKILLPFLFISLGAFGIFLSYGLAACFASVVCIIFLIIKFDYVIKPSINLTTIKKMMKFSFGNYIAGFIWHIPVSALPILIINKIDANNSAYFYMAMMIANILYIIPLATAQSLLAEGSHNSTGLKMHIKKSFGIIFVTLIPAILVTIIFGKYILLAFGKAYAVDGTLFLQLLACTGIFMALNHVGSALLNINHKVFQILVLNTINTVLVLTLSYLFISYQLVGVGFAWLLGNAITSIFYLYYIYKYIFK